MFEGLHAPRDALVQPTCVDLGCRRNGMVVVDVHGKFSRNIGLGGEMSNVDHQRWIAESSPQCPDSLGQQAGISLFPEAGYQTSLPGSLDRAWVVMRADPIHSVVGADPSEYGHSSERRGGTAHSAPTRDLDALGRRTFIGSLQRRERIVSVGRCSKISPPDPLMRPRERPRFTG